jgi:hypothetical protein
MTALLTIKGLGGAACWAWHMHNSPVLIPLSDCHLEKVPRGSGLSARIKEGDYGWGKQ